MAIDKPPTRAPSDAELLREFAASRSAESFRLLVDRHIGIVHAAARRILRDDHLAEDVTQSVFLLLSQRAHKIPPSTPLIGWLYKVTHYACANLKRMERNRQRLERQIAAMRPAHSPTATVSDAQSHLDAALWSLSGHEREAILLRYATNLPLAEIARLTRVSRETTKKRLQRGLGKLRRYFAAQGVTGAADLLAANPSALLALAPAHLAVSLALAPTVAAAALAPLGTAAAGTAGVAGVTSRLIAKQVSRMMALAQIAKVASAVAVIALAWTITGAIMARHGKADASVHVVTAPNAARWVVPSNGPPLRTQTVIVGGGFPDRAGRPITPGMGQTQVMVMPFGGPTMASPRTPRRTRPATKPATQSSTVEQITPE